MSLPGLPTGPDPADGADRRRRLGRRTGFALVLAAGVAARIALAGAGENYDIASYRLVELIVEAGGNVYAETERYNYGPVWLHVIGALSRLPSLGLDPLIALHYKVTLLLTLVDVALAGLLLRRFGGAAAAAFFLNPISILISGYHAQFDNLAVLLAFLAVLVYDSGSTSGSLTGSTVRLRSRVAGLVLLGLSLTTKHVMFLLPAWIALRETRVAHRVLALLVPLSLFGWSFLPYWSDGRGGIVENVLGYRSRSNGPLWSALLPADLPEPLSYFGLFCVALLLLGFLLRRAPLVDAFLVYLVALVAFAPAIANQYLAIPLAATAVHRNVFFLAYWIAGAVFVAADRDGLHLAGLADRLGVLHQHGYTILALLLLVGLGWWLARARGRARGAREE